MRVLVSGSTPQQAGRGTMLKYGPVIDLFVRALRDAGVEVDHRIIEPDDSLDGYDALWVGVSPVNSMAARYMFGVLDALGRAHDRGLPVLYWIDDWQTHLLMPSFKSMIKDPKRLIREPGAALQDTRWGIDWARESTENLDRIVAGLRRLHEEPWPLIVAPFYEWGDHMSVFKKAPMVAAENLVTVDPSRYVDWYPVEPAGDNDRIRQWVLGILSDQRNWMTELGLSPEPVDGRWPLSHTGGRASKATERLKEAELVARYAASWGVLSPPYWHKAGWWRNRFVYAAYAGAVIAGDPTEAMECSAAYTYPVEMIEKFTNSQLRELADWQRRDLVAKMMTKDQVQETLIQAIKRVIGTMA